MSDTSTTDKVVVGGALVGGLLFFGFLTNTCTSPFSMGGDTTGNDSQITTPVIAGDATSANNGNARVAELQKQMDALKLKNRELSTLEKDNDALRAEGVNLSKTHEDAQARLNKKISDLQRQIDASRDSANDLQTKLAAMPTNGSSGLEAKINALTSELAQNKTVNLDLKKQLAAMPVTPDNDSSAKVTTLEGTIKELNTKNASLTADLEKLNQQMKTASANSENGADANTDSNSKVKQLSDAITAQKALLATKSAEITKLTAQVNQFKAQKNVFVKSTDDLPDKAKNLLADLKTLEGKSAEEVVTAYEQITKKNNADAKARIKFRSGKSDLSGADKAKIAELTQAAGENSYFLIVGYADKTGSAAANEKLSSARSTSVAKELGAKAKGFQAAQAVYLGQTDRFGPASENRVVEIWEIK